jgi:hypothetical protein
MGIGGPGEVGLDPFDGAFHPGAITGAEVPHVGDA